ncbi:uncharacterized protein LOC143195203 isoform X1 [Rhynchophorus ferrugineus]|uniref:uncharacterized protein LOC143195203 isoform X1 n=1 Tax=Rhynchophorus ferrugineus TaxID=354439 RepID=UPI003FCDF0BD
MECNMEEVLYRDQRTIRTRFVDGQKRQRVVSADLGSWIGASVPNKRISSNSSSGKHCHSQYSSCEKFYGTTDLTVALTSFGVRSVAVSGKRYKSSFSLLKNLQSVIVFSTYLSFLTFPTYHAQPVRMSSSDSTDRWVIPCGSLPSPPSGPIPSEINTTTMLYVGRNAKHALTFAREDFQKRVMDELVTLEPFIYVEDSGPFKRSIRRKIKIRSAKTGLNPDATFSTVTFDWLPKLPNLSDEQEKQEHFDNLKSTEQCVEGLLTMYKNLQIMAVALDAVVADYNQSSVESLKQGASQLYGLIINILCDLQEVLIQNNIPIKNDVGREVVPDEYRNIFENKTRRAERDWIVLREFIKVMEYTVEASEHLYKEGASQSA